jgi:hypothetical protein
MAKKKTKKPTMKTLVLEGGDLKPLIEALQKSFAISIVKTEAGNVTLSILESEKDGITQFIDRANGMGLDTASIVRTFQVIATSYHDNQG